MSGENPTTEFDPSNLLPNVHVSAMSTVMRPVVRLAAILAQTVEPQLVGMAGLAQTADASFKQFGEHIPSFMHQGYTTVAEVCYTAAIGCLFLRVATGGAVPQSDPQPESGTPAHAPGSFAARAISSISGTEPPTTKLPYLPLGNGFCRAVRRLVS